MKSNRFMRKPKSTCLVVYFSCLSDLIRNIEREEEGDKNGSEGGESLRVKYFMTRLLGCFRLVQYKTLKKSRI